MLLHGLTCSAAYWLRVLPLLDGLSAICVDLRGHGLSAHRDSYRYADYADDLVELLAELGLGGAPLAGHSLGGYVALLAASRGDPVGPVLALDVKSDWTEDDAALAERSRAATQRIDAERRAVVERLRRSIGVDLDEAELETVAARSVEQADGGWRLRWDRRVLATEPVDPFAFLARVPCRVHVMAGATSVVMSPEAARRFAEAIPGATAEVVARSGHHVELEAPELVAARIRELV